MYINVQSALLRNQGWFLYSVSAQRWEIQWRVWIRRRMNKACWEIQWEALEFSTELSVINRSNSANRAPEACCCGRKSRVLHYSFQGLYSLLREKFKQFAMTSHNCFQNFKIKSNQITFIVTSPQHKCLGEWNSYERAPDSAKKKKITYVFTDCTEDNVQNTHTYTQYTQWHKIKDRGHL